MKRSLIVAFCIAAAMPAAGCRPVVPVRPQLPPVAEPADSIPDQPPAPPVTAVCVHGCVPAPTD